MINNTLTVERLLELSNDLSHDNLKSLGFIQDIHSKDYELCCQYKHYKYASKRVALVVSSELDLVYATISVNEFDAEGLRISKTDTTLHFMLDTINELIMLSRMLQKKNINFQK